MIIKSIAKGVGKYISGVVENQMVSHKNVEPKFTWSHTERKFYLNSEAGIIIYKPKSDLDIAKFRNTYINKFDTLIKEKAMGYNVSADFFALYRRILKEVPRSQYKANIHTRIRGGAKCFFGR
jgi:hypothetical protein